MPSMDAVVIGIGAGPSTDGQVMVFHDLLGMSSGGSARFVKRYADLHGRVVDGLRRVRGRGPRRLLPGTRALLRHQRRGVGGLPREVRRPLRLSRWLSLPPNRWLRCRAATSTPNRWLRCRAATSTPTPLARGAAQPSLRSRGVASLRLRGSSSRCPRASATGAPRGGAPVGRPQNAAISSFFIPIIAWKAPGRSMSSAMFDGVTCQLTPNRSAHHPHASASGTSLSAAQYRSISA